MTESTDREEFFKQANIAILATIGPGQRSHAMPIWYLYEDGHFLISASRGSQKVRNVERQGEATLVVDRRDLPYYAVMVRGRAELGDALDDESRLRLAVRYLGEERGKAYTQRTVGGDSVTIHLYPDHIIEYNGVAGRDETDS